jgi:hypothetical protein
VVYLIAYELAASSPTNDRAMRSLLEDWEATHVLGNVWLLNAERSSEMLFFDIERVVADLRDRIIIVGATADFFGSRGYPPRPSPAASPACAVSS